jgi:D-alanine-D-alanine ligase
MSLIEARTTEPALAQGRLSLDAARRRRTRVEELQEQIERLKNVLRLAVVFGGDKTAPGAVINQFPNARSWKSYEKVAEDLAAALQRLGFEVVELVPDDMRLGERLRTAGVNFAWLNTGGVQGLGSMCHAPAMLEMMGIPYVGHGPLAVGSLDFKHLFKRDLLLMGLPTAPFVVWHPAFGDLEPRLDPRFREVFGDYHGPFVVKPVSGRASQNVTVVDDAADLQHVAGSIFQTTENHVLIENFLPGREYCVAVCGPTVAHNGRLERLGTPFVFSAIERMLDVDERIFTSMDQRPVTTDRVRLLHPTTDAALLEQLSSLATKVYRELGIETLVRLDIRADADDRLYVLEANPKPDLKAPQGDQTSLVCAGLAEEGMSYDDLVLGLLADRLDMLFSQRRGTVHHLLKLLERPH